MKKCTRCQKEKPLSDFGFNKSNKDGLIFQCKKCVLEWRKDNVNWQKYQRNYQKRCKRKYQKYGLGMGTIKRYGFKTSLFVYDRVERKCEQCNSENDLTIHHLNGKGRHYQEKGEKPDNNIQNLVVWCRKCHGSFHGKQGKGIKKSFKK